MRALGRGGWCSCLHACPVLVPVLSTGSTHLPLVPPFASCRTDVWRHLHPDVSSTYTVWNERTSARAFNQVRCCSVEPALRLLEAACHVQASRSASSTI
jgi:hypothetical protein